MTKEEIKELHSKIKKYLNQYIGSVTFEIEADIEKIVQSHIEAISKLEEFKNIVDEEVSFSARETSSIFLNN